MAHDCFGQHRRLRRGVQLDARHGDYPVEPGLDTPGCGVVERDQFDAQAIIDQPRRFTLDHLKHVRFIGVVDGDDRGPGVADRRGRYGPIPLAQQAVAVDDLALRSWTRRRSEPKDISALRHQLRSPLRTGSGQFDPRARAPSTEQTMQVSRTAAAIGRTVPRSPS